MRSIAFEQQGVGVEFRRVSAVFDDQVGHGRTPRKLAGLCQGTGDILRDLTARISRSRWRDVRYGCVDESRQFGANGMADFRRTGRPAMDGMRTVVDLHPAKAAGLPERGVVEPIDGGWNDFVPIADEIENITGIAGGNDARVRFEKRVFAANVLGESVAER